MKDDDGVDEYSAPRGHLTVGRRSSAAVEERERQRDRARERERMRRGEGLNTSAVGRGEDQDRLLLAANVTESG